ncbi:MAG TPA: TetR/AcrR family transcriptional regulator C-terminal domain-containing protein [Streptosporangiaceae bacterium]|nr:TetR/AcrR family transcriptional regulator C-terminal domain-containing protein [Streptosporangiaceae bacterium]
MARETLSRDQIVTAALDLLDTDGLEGLNMRALGKRLDSAATAVYWHVGNKEGLIAMAADRAWAEVELPDPAEVGWRTAAYRMATSQYAMLTRHPWLVQAFGSYQLYGPDKARHDDHSLAVYEAAGFAGAEADQATSTVFTFVLGNALGPAAAASFTRKLGRDGGDVEALMQANRAEIVEVAAQFPRLRARLELPSTEYAAAPDGSFEFGLQAVLDGLEGRLAARGKPDASSQAQSDDLREAPKTIAEANRGVH